MCVCVGSPGRSLWRYRNKVQDMMLKTEFKRGAPARKLLAEGFICILFENFGDRQAAQAAVMCNVPSTKEVLLHIGYHCFSPYFSCWQLLHRTGAPEGEPAASETRMYAKVFIHLLIEDASGDAPPPPSFGEDPTHVVVPLRLGRGIEERRGR